jgi:hypothetical protein
VEAGDARVRKEYIQCAVAPVQPPTTKLPRKVPPKTDRKYPTFIVMTANMLLRRQLCSDSCGRYWTYSK